MSTPQLDPLPLDGLPRLEGRLDPDLDARQANADDFGHLVRRLPRAVLRPGSAEDVAAMLRWAGERRWRVAARGQGHSVYGRAQAGDGLVIDMDPFDSIGPIGSDSVAVGAGTTWRAVLDATLPRGLTPPVLTNYLDLSVGGTLSVGGIGGTSHRAGAQTDNVAELEVVTGDGRVLRCSPAAHADLFDAVRAGLGHAGIVTRAVLRLVPAPRQVRLYTLRYPSMAALAAAQRRLLDLPHVDHLQGGFIPSPSGGWMYQLEAAVFATDSPAADAPILGGPDEPIDAEIQDLPYIQFVMIFDGLVEALRAEGRWGDPHPWMLTFLPGSAAERIAAAVLDELAPADLGALGRVLFSPVRTAAFGSRMLRTPDEPIVFPFNLVRFPPADPDLAEQMVAHNRSTYERIRRMGGVLYPVSALAMTPEDWREHFGPAWSDLVAAVDRYDPHRVLAPGQGIF